MNSPHLVIDGYNVIHALPFLKKSLKHGWAPACAHLLDWVRIIHDIDHIRLTVVLDGNSDTIHIDRPSQELTLSVIYTPKHVSADAVIEQIAHNSQSQLYVVTQDHALAQSIQIDGGIRLSPQALADWVERCQARQNHLLRTLQSQPNSAKTLVNWERLDHLSKPKP